MLAIIENGLPPYYLWLTALPSRVYEIINHSSESIAKQNLHEISIQLKRILSSRDDIFHIQKLSRRASVLLALLLDGAIESAYKLGAMKNLTRQTLDEFEQQLT